MRKLTFWVLVLAYVCLVLPSSAYLLVNSGWGWKVAAVWNAAIFPFMIKDTFDWAYSRASHS